MDGAAIIRKSHESVRKTMHNQTKFSSFVWGTYMLLFVVFKLSVIYQVSY
jgi:hypothetical protein